MRSIQPNVFDSQRITALFTTVERGSEVANTDDDYGQSDRLDDPGVRESYQRLFDYLNIDNPKLALARQIHGNHVETVSESGIVEGADGLVTGTPGLILGIRVADCAAILLADTDSGVVGAIHAGWRGAALGILSKGLQTMISLGAKPESMSAFISPCISVENFEVGEEVASQFPDEFVDRQNFVKPHLDLKKFLVARLVDHNLPAGQIECSGDCTVADTRFFSYRREREKAGRMLGLITIRN